MASHTAWLARLKSVASTTAKILTGPCATLGARRGNSRIVHKFGGPKFPQYEPTRRIRRGGRSAFLHGVASEELADASGNRLWALHVQQVSHAFNPAVLDLWEPGVE